MSPAGEPRRIELHLLGQTLTIRSEAPADYLRSLAKYLEERPSSRDTPALLRTSGSARGSICFP